MRFTVHAHREVTPGRWYRAFIGAFEALPTRRSVQTLIEFAKTASGYDAVSVHACAETMRDVQSFYYGSLNPPAIPFVIVNGMMRDELRAVVFDPTLPVPDSVAQQWDQLEINLRKPTGRTGDIPT